jgi:hypothetical protein
MLAVTGTRPVAAARERIWSSGGATSQLAANADDLTGGTELPSSVAEFVAMTVRPVAPRQQRRVVALAMQVPVPS